MRCLFLLSVSVLALSLFLSFESKARPLFLPEKAYLNLGFGGFQCDGFNKTGGYVRKNLKVAYIFKVGVGYRFSDRIRSDINFQYSRLNYKARNNKDRLEQRIKVLSSMLNAYYDFYSDDFMYPYLAIGIGMSNNISANLKSAMGEQFKGKRKINVTWNIGGGVLLNTISKDYYIDVGYRYIDLGKI